MKVSNALARAYMDKQGRQNVARACRWTIARRMAAFTAASSAALLAGLVSSPATAATCQFVGGSQFAGIEPPLAVDGACTDPDYNEKTLVIDSTEQKTLDLPDGTKLAYTEVKGHFPATRTQAQLPAGIAQSPTIVRHGIVWRFPEKKYWRNRFFQQTYPLVLEDLNAVDDRFTFAEGGGYMVGILPGSPNVGYRVPAASAKLAKAYANKLYGNTARIYGYMYGQSGGSVQSMGANEGTIGVWDGIIPVVIATDGLNTHSFMWDAHYALAVPEAKRKAIAEAAAVGSGKDIYAGLTGEERGALDELLNAGFPRIVLESMQFSVGSATALAGPVRMLDPTYEDDFWSKPGYEGVNPPGYLAAARVDGMATIAGVTRDAKGVPTAVTFDEATVPALGSIGATGLQFYVYAGDGATRVTNGEALSLVGKLEGNTLKLEEGKNDAALLAVLATEGKVRINNRFLLATLFYPRHSILDGNPAYNQYRNRDGTPKYVQRMRTTPVPVPYFNNIRSAGGRLQTGRIQVRTMVIENLSDPASFPSVGGLYAETVRRALGPAAFDRMFRIYYQESGSHGAALMTPPGKFGTIIVPTGGILHQALLDLAGWAERGIAPLRSTTYRRDAMNQVVVPAQASARFGLQPVMHLTANGGERAEVAINQPVNLVGRIEMPPKAGKIVQYDWYLGGSDYKFEPATRLTTPQMRATATRTVSFPQPGEYVITLRVSGERDGIGDAATSTTPLMNIARVRVVVAGQSSPAVAGPGAAPFNPALWDVDITTHGTQCLVDPRKVRLRRPAADRPARLRAYGPSNSPSTIVEFDQGATTAPLDTAAFPILDGSTMTVADLATGATIGQIGFAVLPSLTADPQQLAQALQARGCTAQLELLKRSAP
ncbi:MAG: PKD domain-containing protein [Vicinamibacterales bacterium]